jgi:hypothetical protein
MPEVWPAGQWIEFIYLPVKPQMFLSPLPSAAQPDLQPQAKQSQATRRGMGREVWRSFSESGSELGSGCAVSDLFENSRRLEIFAL